MDTEIAVSATEFSVVPNENLTVLKERAEGKYESSPILHDGDCFGTSVKFDRSNLIPGQKVILESFISKDGGETWEFGGGCTHEWASPDAVDPYGKFIGPIIGFNSVVLLAVYEKDILKGYIPKYKNPLIKTRITIIGDPLITTVELKGIATHAEALQSVDSEIIK